MTDSDFSISYMGGFFCKIGGGSGSGVVIVPSTTSYSGCDACLISLGSTAAGCLAPGPLGPAFGSLGCVLNPSLLSCTGALLGLIPHPLAQAASCALGLIGVALDCSYEPSSPLSGSNSLIKSLSTPGNFPVILQQPMDDIYMYTQAYEAMVAIGNQYYGDLTENESILDFATLIDPYITTVEMIDADQRAYIQAEMEHYDISETEIDDFIDRWNTTVQAWGEGVFAPNTTYPDIVDKDLLDAYYAQIQATVDHAEDRGFPDAETMLATATEDVYTLTQPSADPNEERAVNSVCASVTINISQQLTMTREAFEGTLTVYNGHPDIPLEDLALNLEVLNENGVPSNDLFEIETTNLNGLTEIDGTGTLDANQEGTATILFIPEPGAAPQVPQSYSFGGTISYLDPFSGTVVTLPLIPVTLQVNPSPDLFLHYFMQRDILGDDPLTEPVEPIIPADLAVMVENNGYGVAQSVAISSAQPEIIENEKGLAINFSLIGSNLQGEPANLGVTNINFGNIDPFKTKIGQWYFTSDLLGHFVNYQTELVHLDSRGNPDLSLISLLNVTVNSVTCSEVTSSGLPVILITSNGLGFSPLHTTV